MQIIRRKSSRSKSRGRAIGQVRGVCRGAPGIGSSGLVFAAQMAIMNLPIRTRSQRLGRMSPSTCLPLHCSLGARNGLSILPKPLMSGVWKCAALPGVFLYGRKHLYEETPQSPGSQDAWSSLSSSLSPSFLTTRGIAPACSTSPMQGHIPGSVSVSDDSICFTEAGSVLDALPWMSPHQPLRDWVPSIYN